MAKDKPNGQPPSSPQPSKVPGEDALFETLDRSRLKPEQRMEMWNAYHTPGSESDFIGAVDKLPIDAKGKMLFYNMRYKGEENLSNTEKRQRQAQQASVVGDMHTQTPVKGDARPSNQAVLNPGVDYTDPTKQEPYNFWQRLGQTVTGPGTLGGALITGIGMDRETRQHLAQAQLDYARAHNVSVPEAGTALYGSHQTSVVDPTAMEVPGQAQQHPITHGMALGVKDLTEPESIAMVGAGGGLTKAAPEVAAWPTRLFTAQMAYGNIKEAHELVNAITEAKQTGDWTKVKTLGGQMATTVPFTALVALGSRRTANEKGLPVPADKSTQMGPISTTGGNQLQFDFTRM